MQRVVKAHWPAPLLMLCVALFWRQPARAQQVSPRLLVEPGATCLQEAALRTRIDRWLEASTITPGLIIAVHGSESDPRAVAVVLQESQGAASRRDFAPGPGPCDELHDAVALAAALLVRAAGQSAETEPAREPTMPARPPAPAPRPTRKLLMRSAQPQRWTRALTLRGDGLVAANVSATVAGGARLLLGATVSSWLELRVQGLALRSGLEQLRGYAGNYRVSLYAAVLEGCARWPWPHTLTARWCAAFAAGQLRAQGDAYSWPLEARLPWLAVDTGPELSVDLGRWSLHVAVAVAVPVRRTRIVLGQRNGELAAERALPQLGVTASLGLGFRFDLGEKTADPAKGLASNGSE